MPMPAAFYAEQKKAKAQARAMRQMKPEEISVETWLGGYRHLFPDTRSDVTIWDQVAMLRPFRAAHGKTRMWDISAIEAQAWALEHPAQVKLLRQAWKVAVPMRVAPFDVWAIVVKAPRVKELVRPPSREEFDSILRAAWEVDPSRGSSALADLIVTAAYTGGRQGGLLRVRRSEVDLDGDRLVLTEKGEKTRTVVVFPPAQEALNRQRSRRPSRGSTNDPILWPWSPKRVQVAWRGVRGEFPHGFHSLRHFHATWLAEQGVDPLDIAVQLGHTDSLGRPYERHVRRVYDHPDPELALARVAGAGR